jgi:hypothetical protein
LREMSTGPSSGSDRTHAAAWAGTLLVIAILYVATWPVVEIKTGTDGVFYDIDRSGFIVLQPAPWAKVLYKPIHWLANATSGEEPFITADSGLLFRYWFWWKEELRVRGLPSWHVAAIWTHEGVDPARQ